MNPQIHVFAAPADKFFVNSFIIESNEALVLIDTQFLVSTAEALGEAVARLGKPLTAIVITHPHPDHFNGLATLLERFGPVPTYANRPTIDGIAATQAVKREAWTPVYGDDYPRTDALPDHVIGTDETIRLGGIDIRSVDLGPGESSDITVLHVPQADALIASDLIYNACHPWLAEHRSLAWLAQLDRVEALFPDTAYIYPGHGPAGSRALFAAQRAYILDQRAIVAAHARSGVLDEPGMAAVRAAAMAGRPDWPLAALIDMNAAALAAELAEAQS
jgi:glyoxylase-like metal-dependent hydrolase (beta-lactamase superfamily II)